MRRLAAVSLAALALGGCGGSDDGEDQGPRPAPRAGEEERAIRAWSRALNARRYERAASFFARGAIVEQVREVRLPDREAAEAFNRSLPCEADVTDVEADGATFVAAFRLRPGPGGAGACGGDARVRFRFRDGKFSEWRQLAAPQAPPGQVA